MRRPSPELLLSKYEIRREVQNIMGKYTLHYCIMQEYELMKYWSSREDISLAVNTGWFLGQMDVAAFYEARRVEIETASRLIKARFPKELGDKSDQEVMGVGQIAYRPIDTPVIEVADDLKTAKGLWVVRGSYNRVTPGGPVSYWDWSYLAVDFLEEDGQWKIWHLQDLYEVNVEQGLNLTDTPAESPEDPAFAEIRNIPAAKPSVPVTVRRTYAADRPLTPSPEVPVPYDTFANTFTYGYQEVG